MAIHPTALISPQAELDPTVEVGAYAVIDGPVQIGAGTRVYPHAYLTGWTRIGQNCQIHPFTVVGHLPQDVKFADVQSYCQVGDECVLREGVSVHRGTEPGSTTSIGRGCYFMAHSHVGHNCQVGDGVTLINNVMLAGHVHVGNNAMMGGGAGIHQFVRIGELTMIGGNAAVTNDVPPFFILTGRNECVGVNRVGLRRAGLSAEERREIAMAYKLLYRGMASFRDGVARLDATLSTPAGRRLVEFLRGPTLRGFAGRPIKRRLGGVGDEPADESA